MSLGLSSEIMFSASIIGHSFWVVYSMSIDVVGTKSTTSALGSSSSRLIGFYLLEELTATAVS